MSKYHVRLRTDADLPALIQVLQRTHEVDKYPIFAEFVSRPFLEDPKLFKSWVAVRDGIAFGHVSITKSANDPAISLYREKHDSEHMASIVRLFVDPGQRGNGAARDLIEVATTWAQSQGLEVVLNTEVIAVAARKFYEKCGWKVFGETVMNFRSGSQEIVMPLICYEAPGLVQSKDQESCISRWL